MGWRWTLIAAASLGACSEQAATVPVPGIDGATKSTPDVRAKRRAYSGAPPVIPHTPFGAACAECHNARGIHVPDVGFAPPSPHETTRRAAVPRVCDHAACRRSEGV